MSFSYREVEGSQPHLRWTKPFGKEGLRGIMPHLLSNDFEHLGSLSNTRAPTHTSNIHTFAERQPYSSHL